MTNLKITFHLDGTGIYYDPNEPIHLDALLAWALAPMQTEKECSMRGDKPDFIKLPLKISRVNGSLCWHASALFPPESGRETLRFWRKKFRQDRIELTKGSPNLQCSVYREYNIPVPLLLIPTLVCYCSTEDKPSRVTSILQKHIKSLGKKRAYGYGRITEITHETISDDMSLVANGVAMRYIPHPNSSRLVRSIPPYWNSIDRVMCLSPGEPCDKIELA